MSMGRIAKMVDSDAHALTTTNRGARVSAPRLQAHSLADSVIAPAPPPSHYKASFTTQAKAFLGFSPDSEERSLTFREEKPLSLPEEKSVSFHDDVRLEVEGATEAGASDGPNTDQPAPLPTFGKRSPTFDNSHAIGGKSQPPPKHSFQPHSKNTCLATDVEVAHLTARALKGSLTDADFDMVGKSTRPHNMRLRNSKNFGGDSARTLSKTSASARCFMRFKEYLGRAVQIDLIKATLKALGTKRTKPKYD